MPNGQAQANEMLKFRQIDERFHVNMDDVTQMPVPPLEIIHNYPAYAGAVNLGRHLALYELYKRTIELAGHVAEVGVWKGASYLFLAKLVQLFEPHSPTRVHGFDWFKGMAPDPAVDDTTTDREYAADEEQLRRLINAHDLEGIAALHNMDVTQDLVPFLETAPHIRFKLVFVDCGIKDVLEHAISALWPRIVPGGILVVDHYNTASSPHESRILEAHTGGLPVRQLPFARQPTGYVVKE